jgi:hypothetical protein
MQNIILEKELNELVLDKANPRFAELYNGSDKEEDLIEYLLYTESGEDIARDISEVKEFYPDRPLWVIEDNGKYLVKDGNRRCAAVKALQCPQKYKLNLSKFNIEKLPVIIYKNENDLNKRIIQEHTASLFRKWDRIAKALEAYKIFKSGKSIESMKELDSSPSDLIKLASFYYEAVKIGGDDLKRLLRRGRGLSGGKTIIFERLFKYKNNCGYKFKNKPSYKIDIFDKKRFNEYISSIIDYLKKYPETTHKKIDDDVENFFIELNFFGFDIKNNKNNKGVKKTKFSAIKKILKKTTIQDRPNWERKGVILPLKKLINECYDLDCNNFANAKTALTRLSFECTLKYVIGNTEYKGKNISNYQYFKDVFYHKDGKERLLMNFTILKDRFSKLIIDRDKKDAFTSFDLNMPHQIIHNYNVGAIPFNAKALCGNLIVLLEFMLQDEKDFLNSIDLTKL